MTPTTVRNIALTLLVLTLPLPYYLYESGFGLVPWLALAMLSVFQLIDTQSLGNVLVGLQVVAYGALFWLLASSAAAWLATLTYTGRGIAAWVLAFTLITSASLPICSAAGNDARRMPAFVLELAFLAFAAVS